MKHRLSPEITGSGLKCGNSTVYKVLYKQSQNHKEQMTDRLSRVEALRMAERLTEKGYIIRLVQV